MKIINTTVRINDETQPETEEYHDNKPCNRCREIRSTEKIEEMRRRQELGLPLFDDE